MERCIDNYVERIITNSCFQKLINRELSLNKRSEITDKMTSILMTNVYEFKKIIQDGIDNGQFHSDADQELVVLTIFGTKNYIVNSPHIVSRLLGIDTLDDTFLEEKLKPRMKVYMKRLIKSYLVKQQ
jgi:hypothetical protein